MRYDTEYGAKPEEYEKLGEYIKINQPEYYESFKKVVYGKKCYFNTMFISSNEFLDEYFPWLFSIFNDMYDIIDFDSYAENNKRVFAFFAEPLLSIYVDKNNLKIKEHWIKFTFRKYPIVEMLFYKFPILRKFDNFTGNVGFMLRHILKKL